jgi:transformation/transcription domain-associated protein
MLGGVQTSENPPDASQPGRKTAWDYLIDILQILKTGFPLLALTMETMVDQLQANFKPSPAEETYRHLNSFSAEAVFVSSMPFPLGGFSYIRRCLL